MYNLYDSLYSMSQNKCVSKYLAWQLESYNSSEYMGSK